MYAFANENSWLMKFWKLLWKRCKNTLQWKKFMFKQSVDEVYKLLIDEKDVCMQTGGAEY